MTPQGDLLITILRAVGQLSREDLSTRPGHAGWPEPTPLAQCRGPDRLQLAICSVSRDDIAAGTVLPQLWEDVFLPPRATWLRQATMLGTPPVDIRLEGPGLVFSALKPAEEGDAFILRCYNATDAPTSGVWRLSLPVNSAERTRADEREPQPVTIEDGGRVLRFTVEPREIVSIRATVLPITAVSR